MATYRTGKYVDRNIEFKWKETGLSFQVQFIKKNNITDNVGGNVGGNVDLQNHIIELIRTNSTISIQEIADTTGLSKRNCERIMAKLKSSGLIARNGSPRSGHWIIMK